MRDTVRCVREGSIGGLYAGLAILAFFFIFDLLQLRPFATQAHLGNLIVGAAPDAAPEVQAALQVADVILYVRGIATFALLHFGVFVAIGIGAAFLFFRAGLPINILSGALYGAIVASIVFYVGLELFGGGLAAAPDWRMVLVANALAGVIIVAQLSGARAKSRRART